MALQRTLEIGYCSFGIDLSGKYGFKILLKQGLLGEIQDSELSRIFQLPLGIEIKKNATIFCVVRFYSNKTNKYHIYFVQYKYSQLDATNRLAYYGSTVGYIYNNYHAPSKDIIEFLETLSRYTREIIYNKQVQLSIPSLIGEPYEIEYNEPLKDKFGILYNDSLSARILLDFFELSKSKHFEKYVRLFLTNNKSVLLSVDNSIIQHERYTISDIEQSMYSKKDPKRDIDRESTIKGEKEDELVITAENYDNTGLKDDENTRIKRYISYKYYFLISIFINVILSIILIFYFTGMSKDIIADNINLTNLKNDYNNIKKEYTILKKEIIDTTKFYVIPKTLLEPAKNSKTKHTLNHKVKSGESIFSISKTYCIPVDSILKLNPNDTKDSIITVGDILYLGNY